MSGGADKAQLLVWLIALGRVVPTFSPETEEAFLGIKAHLDSLPDPDEIVPYAPDTPEITAKRQQVDALIEELKFHNMPYPKRLGMGQKDRGPRRKQCRCRQLWHGPDHHRDYRNRNINHPILRGQTYVDR